MSYTCGHMLLIVLWSFLSYAHTDQGSVLIPQPCTEGSSLVTGANRVQFSGTIFISSDRSLGAVTSAKPSTELFEPMIYSMDKEGQMNPCLGKIVFNPWYVQRGLLYVV